MREKRKEVSINGDQLLAHEKKDLTSLSTVRGLSMRVHRVPSRKGTEVTAENRSYICR